MVEKNSLNYLFLKRFTRLLHVFLPLSRLSLNVHQPNERIYSHPLVLILLILINEGGLQFVIYYVGLLPKQYYDQLGKSPDKRDIPAFRLLVLRSFGLIISNALLKSVSSLLSSILYVKWRTRLIFYLHSFYFTQKRYYHVLNTTQQNPNKRDDEQIIVYENYSVEA